MAIATAVEFERAPSAGPSLALLSGYATRAWCGIVTAMIELADVIADLRDELDAARRRGTGEDLRFELGPVELEVSVAVQKDAGGTRR